MEQSLRGAVYLKIGKLLINILKAAEDTLEQLHAKTGIKTTGSGTDTMYAQVRDTAINSSYSDLCTSYRANCAPATRIFLNLGDL